MPWPLALLIVALIVASAVGTFLPPKPVTPTEAQIEEMMFFMTSVELEIAVDILATIVKRTTTTMVEFAKAIDRCADAINVDVDQDFAGQFCVCGHAPHTGTCLAWEGWDGGAPTGRCECPSYRPDPSDPGF